MTESEVKAEEMWFWKKLEKTNKDELQFSTQVLQSCVVDDSIAHVYFL